MKTFEVKEDKGSLYNIATWFVYMFWILIGSPLACEMGWNWSN